jgi:hypothetical protein
MYRPQLDLKSFDILPIANRISIIGYLIEALIGANILYLLRFPSTPSLYDIGAQYQLKEHPMGLDNWKDIPAILESKGGDCKDFVAYRVAYLRLKGMHDVTPLVTAHRVKDILIYHVRVRHAGFIEDPSKLLGMPSNVRYEDLKR